VQVWLFNCVGWMTDQGVVAAQDWVAGIAAQWWGAGITVIVLVGWLDG
jgi:hypothetical protein